MPRLASVDAHFKAIGRVAVNFSGLEFLIRQCIVRLLDAGQDEGLMVTSALDFRRLTDLLDSLYKRKFVGQPKKIEILRALLSEVDEAANKRNAVIHTTWRLSESGSGKHDVIGVRFPRGRHKWFQPEYSTKKVSDLVEIADYIEGVIKDVGRLLLEIMESTSEKD